MKNRECEEYWVQNIKRNAREVLKMQNVATVCFVSKLKTVAMGINSVVKC